ncbi:GRP family sugar transporter, partial [Staphylococcus aureus]|uniref:GRP family sugar transporter n=1 Tax=Staphylococcus aureus TaxID=1280 RepID=UPI0034D269CC|nr:ribose transporter RbsU [Staphylococcus aureus]
QLLGANLLGDFALGNCPGNGQKIIGFKDFVVILICALMTFWTERKEAINAKNLRGAVVLLLFGYFGYWLFSAAPKATSIDG